MALPTSQALLKDKQIASPTYAIELPSSKPIIFMNPNAPTRHFPLNKSTFAVRSNKALLSIGKAFKFGPSDIGFEGQSRSYGRGNSLGGLVVKAAATAEKPRKNYPGEAKGFVEEMRFVAMKLHTRDVAKEGKKEPDAQPIGKWEPTIEGYLKFLVDSKVVYDTLEDVVQLFHTSRPPQSWIKASVLEFSVFLAQSTAQTTAVNKAICTRLLWQIELGPQLLTVETGINGGDVAQMRQQIAQKSAQNTGGITAVGYFRDLAKGYAWAKACETAAAAILSAVAESGRPFRGLLLIHSFFCE